MVHRKLDIILRLFTKNGQAAKYGALFLLLGLTFQVLFRLPWGNTHIITSTILITYLFIFFLWYLVDVIIAKKRLHIIDILLIHIFLVTAISALQSNRIFGQPILYGLLNQRTNMLAIAGILLLVSLKRGWITLKELEKAFLFTTCIFLAVYLFYYLFINPEFFGQTQYVANSRLKGYVYKFENVSVVILVFYSLFKIAIKRQRVYLLSLLCASSYLILLVQKRILLFSLASAITIFVFLLLYRKRKSLGKITVLRWLIILALLFIAALITLPSISRKYVVLISETVNTFTIGESRDVSSSKRIEEINTALPYIKKNLLIGNGQLSRRWGNAQENTFGYFYPADIGILGTVFVYGVAGTLVFYGPFMLALMYSLKTKVQSDIFLMTSQYTLLYLFISSFFDANNVNGLGIIFLLLAVVSYYYQKKMLKT